MVIADTFVCEGGQGESRTISFCFYFLMIIQMISGILWQRADFDSASNELYPPVGVKLQISSRCCGLWKRAASPCWLGGCPVRSRILQHLSLCRGETGKWAEVPTAERQERSRIQGQPGPKMGQVGRGRQSEAPFRFLR